MSQELYTEGEVRGAQHSNTAKVGVASFVLVNIKSKAGPAPASSSLILSVMSLRLDVTRHLDVTVMQGRGRVTLGEGSVVYRDAVREAAWNGQMKLAVGYGGIDYQDSSGNGELVSSITTLANSGGKLVLFDLGKRISDMFRYTKLYTCLSIYDSLDAALAYFDSTRKLEIRVNSRRYFNVSVLGLEGSITERFEPSKILSATQSALDSGAQSVILLCPQVLDVDHAGAKNLIEARRLTHDRGGDLVIAGAEERLLPVLSTHEIIDELPQCKTLTEALGIFGLSVDRSKWRIEVVRAF